MLREFAAHLKGTLNGQLASERMFRRGEEQRVEEGGRRGVLREMHQSVPSEKRIKLGQQQTKHLATPSFDLAKWHVCKLSNGAGSVQRTRGNRFPNPPPLFPSSTSSLLQPSRGTILFMKCKLAKT